VPPLRQPPQWDNAQLTADRRQAIANFIEARQREVAPRYRRILAENGADAARLFAATHDLRDMHTGDVFAATPPLLAIARYLTGPPLSADDLNTLAGSSIATRARLDGDLARKAAEVIGDALDRERVPWLFTNPPRAPTELERQVAVSWTAGLKTAQQVQTGTRALSSQEQERAVRAALARAGYTPTTGDAIGFVDDLQRGAFRGRETLVAGAKCDIPVRLHDGRLMLIECKVSNSEINSHKRVIRDTVGVAPRWRAAFGTQAITALVLAGVVKLATLSDAQDNHHITIFWQHNLTALEDFVRSAR